MNNALQLVLIYSLFGGVAWWARRWDRPDHSPGMLWGFWSNTLRSLAGWGIPFGVAAVAVTWWMVASGVDRGVQDWWQEKNFLSHTFTWTFLVATNFWTLLVALGLWYLGRRRGDAELRLAGAASVQAVLGAFVITHTLKVLTGRRGPYEPGHGQFISFPKVEEADDFAFDFWNHSISDGRFFWPSGHTLSAMVFITVLVAFYPRQRWIAFAGYIFVLFMGVTMVDGDHHWSSDVVAALLLGLPIGWRMARSFQREHHRRTDVAGET